MTSPAHDPDAYTVTIGGIPFRPVSSFTLTFLASIHSPLITGGNLEPLDFTLFAWAHGAPKGEVVEALHAGTYSKAALEWSFSAPPEVFAVYTPKKMRALAADLRLLFADKKSGFIPFPCPSRSKKRLNVRAWISSVLRFRTGSPQPSKDATGVTV